MKSHACALGNGSLAGISRLLVRQQSPAQAHDRGRNPAKEPGCRPTYVSCEQLDLKELTLHIGVFDTESTTVACPSTLSSGPATVQVNYRTGEPFYMIDTSFSREGLNQNVSAGPFAEADSEWQMLIR